MRACGDCVKAKPTGQRSHYMQAKMESMQGLPSSGMTQKEKEEQWKASKERQLSLAGMSASELV